MTARFCRPIFGGSVLLHPLPRKNGRRSQNAATGVVGQRAPLWGAIAHVPYALRIESRLTARVLYQTLHDAQVVNQSNRKRCWSTALQKLLLQSFTVETQRVGRARSPLRAGVGRADPASRAGIPPSAPLRARLHGLMRPCGYRLQSWQAHDCPGRRRPAAKMAARQICPKAYRVGRARSPLRAGVGRADPASRAGIRFSALLRARLRGAGLLVQEKTLLIFWMRRAEDCPPYQSGCDGARPSGAQ